MTTPHPLHRPLDGRQTGGRKGMPYDWRHVLLETLDRDDTTVDDAEFEALLVGTPA